MCGSDTRVFVIDVPILAPIIIGMAVEISRAPPATIPTTIEVVDEEDCIMEVANIPIKRPATGFVVVEMSDLANSFPNIFREALINSRLRINR
jgi:hypothetical protein